MKEFIFGYGSTEAMCVAATNHEDDLHKQLEYAGKVPPAVEVGIIQALWIFNSKTFGLMYKERISVVGNMHHCSCSFDTFSHFCR